MVDYASLLGGILLLAAVLAAIALYGGLIYWLGRRGRLMKAVIGYYCILIAFGPLAALALMPIIAVLHPPAALWTVRLEGAPSHFYLLQILHGVIYMTLNRGGAARRDQTEGEDARS